MKVKLLPTISSFSIDGIRYKPGDIFDVDPHYFREDHMESLEPQPTVKPVPEVTEPTVEPAVEESAVEDSIIEETVVPPPVKKKKTSAKKKIEEESTSDASKEASSD